LTCTTLLAQQDPKAKVVILTGGRATEHEARKAGARAFVEKPFDIWHLDQVIHALARA
jgi:ActR/RegA family two-component response regulator